MAVTAPPPRKYNPGFLTDDELVASFCVRTREFESIVEMLGGCTGSSNQHQIVIGPRGSGKTSLLLRVAAEVRRDARLSATFFPIVFAEESYEVATAGEFWLECLARLADQAPQREDGPDLRLTVEDLRTIRDDRTLGERCLATLLDFSDREDKRLVLMVENLNMMFRDMADSREAGWRLRKTLQTEPRIILLASATSRFDEIDHPEHAMYDLFRTLTLRPLDTSECAVLWEAVSGRDQPPEAIRSLEILTGGSPRLLAILARFGGGLSFQELMADLLDLVDDHTDYFKSHLESLPVQERRVYLALAGLWKPAFTKEIADRARLETSKCSAQLTRLVERGAVQVAGGTARRKQYYLSERLYNIYYLLRRNRGSDRLIETLIRFMASYYSPDELIEPSIQLPASSDEMTTVPTGVRRDHRSDAQLDGTKDAPEAIDAKAIFNEADGLWKKDRAEDALAIFDDLVSRFGEREMPSLLNLVAKALVHKGVILIQLKRLEEALDTCDEVMRRFGESETQTLLEEVAKALVNMGNTLIQLNRPEEALDTCNEVMRRFGESKTQTLRELVTLALVHKGVTLFQLNRLEEALDTCDEVMRRFGESKTQTPCDPIAKVPVNIRGTLIQVNHSEEQPDAREEIGLRSGESETPILFHWVAMALANKGDILVKLDRPTDALDAWDEVVRHFGGSKSLQLREVIGIILLRQATLKLEYRQYEAVIETIGRALDQYLTESSVNRWRGHLIRAKAELESGRLSACEYDIEVALTVLSELDSLPKEALDDLIEFSVALGPVRIREQIQALPVDFLSPLTTALEWELGLEPRVAREIEEVARDISGKIWRGREKR